MNSQAGSTPGWRVSHSIALELETMTSFMRMSPNVLPRHLLDFVATIPTTWVDEFEALRRAAAAADASEVPVLEYLGRWAGVLEIEDYDTASAAMRELSPEDAIRSVIEDAGLERSTGLDPIETLIDLEARLASDLWARFGIRPASDALVAKQERDLPRMAALSLRTEPLHGRFWHWMDRFYYEAYGPWRADNLDTMQALEQTAIKGLGSRKGIGPPDVAWLAYNPLTFLPSIGSAVEAGKMDVVFWAEPFGLSTAVAAAPGMFLMSFAERGVSFEVAEAIQGDLARKFKALADPTRLGVLRMVRNMDVDNTQLAGFLEVSRPTVSVHAKILADAGFITTRREGRQAQHAFHPEALRQLCEDLLRYLDVPEVESDE